MIVRLWHGRAERSRADAYPAHFHEKMVPEFVKVPGFMGADLLRRDIGSMIEFTVMTRWESQTSVETFAGNNAIKAMVDAGTADALADYDEHVTLYDLVVSIRPAS